MTEERLNRANEIWKELNSIDGAIRQLKKIKKETDAEDYEVGITVYHDGDQVTDEFIRNSKEITDILIEQAKQRLGELEKEFKEL